VSVGDTRGVRCSQQRQNIPRYAVDVAASNEPARSLDEPFSVHVRDPLADPAAVLAARTRPMSERLELALSWNKLAAELRAGVAEATRITHAIR
jgi:hypothetical protein